MSTTNSTTSVADCLHDRPLLLSADCLRNRPSLSLADCLRNRPSLPPADCLCNRLLTANFPTDPPADLSATIEVHNSEALAQEPGTYRGLGRAKVLVEIDSDTVVLVAAFTAKYHHLCKQRAQLLLHQRQQHWVATYEYIQKSFSLELMTPGRAATWLQ
jgi:hypothetical protein